jgi:hypothetical protein
MVVAKAGLPLVERPSTVAGLGQSASAWRFFEKQFQHFGASDSQPGACCGAALLNYR